MANKFIDDQLGSSGQIAIDIKRADGSISHMRSKNKTSKAFIFRIIKQIVYAGDPAPVENFGVLCTQDSLYSATNRGGIYCFNQAGDHTLLNITAKTQNTARGYLGYRIGTSNNFPNIIAVADSVALYGSNSFYDNGTLSYFNLGGDNLWSITYLNQYFASHAPTAGAFEYSAGDTITVSWSLAMHN
ncbi:MAG: hypothetical protein CMB80_02230 [Flammeovirgaceae bacterium]|nr:hypothetical protein [Flammeovirgaceae bacterium]|tara:strand:+ start:122 stop:682 length:561 start_codon:yes stop_codon:yes gene_type:complete